MLGGAALVLLLAGCATTEMVDLVPPPEPTVVATPSPAAEDRIVDGGPQEGAQGTTTLHADGGPRTYTVAEGDTADQIRQRFNLWWDQLADENGTRLPDYPIIYPGQLLRFVTSKVAFEGDNIP